MTQAVTDVPAELGRVRVFELPLHQVRPSPENDRLYRPAGRP